MFRDDEDIWDEMVDLLLNESDGYIAVLRLGSGLRAYVDASERKESGLFSVAAYMFESGRVRRFRQQWRDTFGQEKFSWADLIGAGRGDQDCHPLFRGIQRPEHDRLVKAGVAIVRDYTIAGSIVSCWTQDVENYSPTWIRGFGHAYSICCHMCMVGMGAWAKRNNYKGRIAYVLEAGDEFHSEADDLLSYAANADGIADMYQWKSHGALPKDVGSPFHAPDLLAWEWGKFMNETAIQKKRLMRLSSAHLLKDRLDNYSFQHLTGDPLLKFFNQIRDLGVQQMQEDRAAVSSVPSMDVSEQVQASEQKEPVGDPE